MGNIFNRESPFTSSVTGSQADSPYAPNYSLQGQGAFAGAVSGSLSQAMHNLQAQMNAGLYQGYQPPTIADRLRIILELQYYDNGPYPGIVDFGELERQHAHIKIAVLCGEYD